MRVGLGYDSHRFDSARELVLGGVPIPGHPGLAGHSDGDAVLHAVTDALLGAAGLGSIGEHFPDSDPDLAGADSATFLAHAVYLVEAENYQVVNADVTVITETPRILEHAPAMRERLAELLHVSPGAVCAKGKSNEGMGFVGRGEGLAVMAVTLIDRIGDTDALHASLRTG
ncbi:MAG: 2-C-methyl-D-erythritol 2,4-cyclodiphosphate synthase [Gemmatimonadota bacterium]